MKNKSERSVMLKHRKEDHKSEEKDVKNPMTRQIDEVCRMEKKSEIFTQFKEGVL